MLNGLTAWHSKNVAEVANGQVKEQDTIKSLNNQTFSWFHVKVIIVAGMGFFCDAYDLFNISYVTNTIGRVYYPDTTYYSPAYCLALNMTSHTCGSNYAKFTTAPYNFTAAEAALQVPSGMPADINYAIKAVALIGTLFGQFCFGYLGDRLGRRPMFGISLAIMIFGAIAQGLSFGSSANAVVATLCVWRFILGFGIGGDYPLSATYMSEYASKSNRGALVGSVFAMQGVGIFFAAIVTMIVSACFQGYPESADYLWRTVLMLGAVPTAACMYFRLNLPETPRYTLFAKQNEDLLKQEMEQVLNPEATTAQLVVADKGPTAKIDYPAILKKYGWQLFGTASCWFLLDIAYYSQNLFQPVIYSSIGWLPPAYSMDPITEAYLTGRANLIIALCSVIPGYWVTVALVDKIGRVKIQIMGFAVMTICMLILTAAYPELTAKPYTNVPAFIVIYALAFFFANFGPNATTFIIPSELFPTVFRSTAHGISAGSGKLGSIIGTFGFGFASSSSIGLQGALAILTVVNFLGLLCTFFVPETMGKSLEEMSGDGSSGTTTELKDLASSPESKASDADAGDDAGAEAE